VENIVFEKRGLKVA